MKPQEFEQFSQLITDVLAFYRQDVSGFALQVWWQACANFELEQVTKALTAHAMDAERGQFAPKPADLVRQLAGTATDRAMLAWGKVHDAMGRVGAYQDVVFDDAVIHAVVEDLGGWVKLCRTEIKELGYVQHRFAEAYRAYAGKPEGMVYPRKLIGEGNQANDAALAMRGLKPPAPAVVGDRDRARAVYRAGGVGAKTQIAFNNPVQALGHVTRQLGVAA